MVVTGHHRDMENDSLDWHVAVPRYDGHALHFSWTGDYVLRVRVLGNEVVIEGDTAGLENLARQLLTLAQPGVPSGSHPHLEPGIGLEEGASLILDREDGPWSEPGSPCSGPRCQPLRYATEVNSRGLADCSVSDEGFAVRANLASEVALLG
jgi:hypothetical protein